MSMEQLQSLAAYRKLVERAAEKVAENIVEDLLTEVLDWSL